MKAKDVMTTKVVAVSPEMPVNAIAALLLERHVSAVPVIDEDRRILGIVSEGDLMRRGETARRGSWWLAAFVDAEDLADQFVKTHGQRAKDVMTREVVTVTEDTPVVTIAEQLEQRGIKRVPVVREDRLVGIVSRADLLRVLATRGLKPMVPESQEDGAIREQFLGVLEREPWADTTLLSIVVEQGVIHLWGLVRSESERHALHVAAEAVPGVRGVQDHLRPWGEVAVSASQPEEPVL
ncbi:MAG: CBS domain-containing protein [Candidatus Methylomirabilales bacterium]